MSFSMLSKYKVMNSNNFYLITYSKCLFTKIHINKENDLNNIYLPRIVRRRCASKVKDICCTIHTNNPLVDDAHYYNKLASIAP